MSGEIICCDTDLDEFMQIATAKNSEDYYDDMDEDEERATGRIVNPNDRTDEPELVCQYTLMGPGYRPCGPTIPELPPGIYRMAYVSGVAIVIPQKIVTDDLLRLPDSKSDQVVSEIEHFWELKDRFQKFGLVHKRGFLLWGPPGGGKTATVALVLKKIVESGGLSLLIDSDPGAAAGMLSDIRKAEPERPIVVVMEDIDTLISYHGESDVLSLLDGENSIANVAYLATTNYPENLAGRIINRPSRFDRIVKIGTPSASARRVYLESRNLGLSDSEMDAWIDATKEFTLAHIKELIVGVLCFGNNFKTEIKRIKEMRVTPKSDDTEGRTGFSTDR